MLKISFVNCPNRAKFTLMHTASPKLNWHDKRIFFPLVNAPIINNIINIRQFSTFIPLFRHPIFQIVQKFIPSNFSTSHTNCICMFLHFIRHKRSMIPSNHHINSTFPVIFCQFISPSSRHCKRRNYNQINLKIHRNILNPIIKKHKLMFSLIRKPRKHRKSKWLYRIIGTFSPHIWT